MVLSQLWSYRHEKKVVTEVNRRSYRDRSDFVEPRLAGPLGSNAMSVAQNLSLITLSTISGNRAQGGLT